MWYLNITGNWNYIYVNYLPAIEYTYLNLDVEATIMPVSKVYKHPDTYEIKCKIFDKNETGDGFHYLFIFQYFRKTAIHFSKSINKNFQVCINLLN